MLDKENIKKYIKEAYPLFPKIEEIYFRLPETRCKCDAPGQCCTTMPEMTVIEALQWLDVILKMPAKEKLETIKNFVSFYFSTPLKRLSCPFLMNNSCSNYSFRTFACRAYGMWSAKSGEQRTIMNRHNRKETVKVWQRMGVNLPIEKVIVEMDYCDQVVQKTTDPIEDKRLFAELQKLYKLSSKMEQLQKQFEEEFHSDFSYLIACLLFPRRKVLLSKLAVIKELHEQGTDSRLQKILSKVTVEYL